MNYLIQISPSDAGKAKEHEDEVLVGPVKMRAVMRIYKQDYLSLSWNLIQTTQLIEMRLKSSQHLVCRLRLTVCLQNRVMSTPICRIKASNQSLACTYCSTTPPLQGSEP